MDKGKTALAPETYMEPRCLLRDEPYGAVPPARSVPQQRIAAKLDAYMGRRDYAGAERHLLYWVEEAKLGRDLRGELFLCGELVGYYRKTANREEAFRYAERALALLDELDYEGSVTAGTTLVNIATAYSAFGEEEHALTLFEQARAIYEASSMLTPALLAGLYNNMATTCQALDRLDEAFALYEKALALMEQVSGGELERAVTCLNMADAVLRQQGLESGESRISELLDQAYDLLRDPSVPRNGYYAFVCEKCAPAFAYYGYFAAAEELKQAATSFYERS